MNISVVATFTTDPFVKPLYRSIQLALQVLQVGEDSKVLTDANPHSQIVAKTGKNLLDLIAVYKEHIKKSYGDEIDLVKWEKFIMVSTHHTQNFFAATVMSPHKFHYSLPIAVFNSNENHMGLHKWARVISDNLVHVSVIKFQRRSAYKEVFAHEDKLIQDHNVAMVHDEFVDNLLLNLNPLLEKYGGGGGQHTLTS